MSLLATAVSGGDEEFMDELERIIWQRRLGLAMTEGTFPVFGPVLVSPGVLPLTALLAKAAADGCKSFLSSCIGPHETGAALLRRRHGERCDTVLVCGRSAASGTERRDSLRCSAYCARNVLPELLLLYCAGFALRRSVAKSLRVANSARIGPSRRTICS